MERYKHAPYASDWYIFDGRFRLGVDEDYLSIDSIHPSFRKQTLPDPLQAPHVQIALVGGQFLRRIVTRSSFPLTIEFTGERIGSVAHNKGYDIAASGAYTRKILAARLNLDLLGRDLRIRVSGDASPVLQQTPPISIVGDELKPMQFEYSFDVPVHDVPEILNMNETERRRYRVVLTEIESADG
jgi:hypothetical protein